SLTVSSKLSLQFIFVSRGSLGYTLEKIKSYNLVRIICKSLLKGKTPGCFPRSFPSCLLGVSSPFWAFCPYCRGPRFCGHLPCDRHRGRFGRSSVDVPHNLRVLAVGPFWITSLSWSLYPVPYP